MSINKKTNKTYLQTIRLPILISTAITIVALCGVLYSWGESSREYQYQQFSSKYNQGLADTSAAFLGHLIEDEDTETIESIGDQLEQQDAIQKVSIYRRNGELIYQQGEQSQSPSDPVIANISFDDDYNGYLILYFVPTSNFLNKEQPLWFNPTLIWFFGILTWLIVLVLLYANRWFKSTPAKAKKSQQSQSQAAASSTQLLKDLIRRNKQNKGSTLESSIVIKARWSTLNDQSNKRLLRILSRWLPQNGLFATQFSEDLLSLGVTQEHSPIKRNPLYALEHCFEQLQLEPKIIVHRLDFGQDIYKMFFDIIEPGIWFEKRLIETGSQYNWPKQKTIDIELDDHTVIELCQLAEPDAEQSGLIERQVRFLSDD